MALRGETISTGAPSVCSDCNIQLEEMVLMSGAGYYIGTECHCGPYSRESKHYWATREEANGYLALNDWVRRDTGFNPSGLTWETLDTEEI